MRRLLAIAVLLVALAADGQVSYWFQGFQRQGNAQYAQQYFATNGTGIAFSFDGLHWVISATGTSTNVATNSIYSQFATNWLGSNAFYTLLSTNPFHYCTNCPSGLTVTQNVLFWTGVATNQWTNVYANGLLIASGQVLPSHAPSWIWPDGGYILWPSGGTILLP